LRLRADMGLVIRRRVVLGAVAHIELRSTLRIHLDGRATHAALLRAHRPRGHNDTEHGQHRGSERDPTHAAGLPTESHSTSSSLGSMTPPTRHVLHRVPQGGLHGPSPPGWPTGPSLTGRPILWTSYCINRGRRAESSARRSCVMVASPGTRQGVRSPCPPNDEDSCACRASYSPRVGVSRTRTRSRAVRPGYDGRIGGRG